MAAIHCCPTRWMLTNASHPIASSHCLSITTTTTIIIISHGSLTLRCVFHFTLGSACWSVALCSLCLSCPPPFTFGGLVISCSHSNDHSMAAVAQPPNTPAQPGVSGFVHCCLMSQCDAACQVNSAFSFLFLSQQQSNQFAH